MAAGYDGSINIDTRINTKGFNEGAEKVNKSMAGVAKAIGAAFSTAAIVSFVKGAIDSFSLMSSSFGMELKALGVAMLGLKGAVVNAIAPAFAAIFPYLLQAIDFMTLLFQRVAMVAQAFFGLASSTKAAALAQKELTKAIGAGALASFDKLNVLSAKPSLPGLGMPDPETMKAVEEFKQKLMDLLQPAIDALDRLKKSLEPLTQTIWEGLKWAWDNILVPLGKWVISDVLPRFLDLVGAGAKALNEILIALKPLGVWFWENFLKPAGAWVGQALLDALDWLNKRLIEFGDWVKAHQDIVQRIAIVIGSFAAAWALVNIAVGIWNVIGVIATGVTTAFGAAVAFLASPMGLAILLIGLLIATILLLAYHWEDVKRIAAGVWDWIVKTWNGAGEWFNKNVGEPVKNAFKTALDWVDDKWRKIWGGIKDFVKGSVNSIIDFINTMILAIANGINAVIGGLNSISVKIPDWVPGFGGQQWGLSLPPVAAPQIPRLATGAVIPPNAAFAAVLGDQTAGTNIEAPESLIRQIMQEEIGSMRAEITLNFEGSLAALVRELKPYVDRENIRVGGSLVKGVVKV